MKKLFISISTALTAMYLYALGNSEVVAAPTDQKAISIGIVYSSKISKDYYKIEELNALLLKELNAAQKELLSMASEFDKMAKEYHELSEKSENPALTEDAKKKIKLDADAKLEILKQKEHAIRDFKVNSENRIAKMKMEEGAKVMAMINQKIGSMAKAKEMSLVFDGDNPGVFYAAESLDMTGAVLEALNAEQAKSATTTAPVSTVVKK
ncbi:MAG: OmpH family outer membrane protein [Puniceicoccales bacterium]|jgi:Skp family chaperone for outer membrane proteins|nr:OmpH family outer membrane protein [Puniceicoccales bacterium]